MHQTQIQVPKDVSPYHQNNIKEAGWDFSLLEKSVYEKTDSFFLRQYSRELALQIQKRGEPAFKELTKEISKDTYKQLRKEKNTKKNKKLIDSFTVKELDNAIYDYVKTTLEGDEKAKANLLAAFKQALWIYPCYSASNYKV